MDRVHPNFDGSVQRSGCLSALDRSWAIQRWWLVVAALVVVAADGLRTAASGLAPEGLLDETAHLATGIVVLGMITRTPSRLFALGVLASSVLIDLDHVPGALGAPWLTDGTARPYPHSVLTLLVVLAVALAARGRARVALAATLLGLAVHFLRDMAEPASGVALLWPVSDQTFSVPYLVYLAALLAAVAAALRRSPSHAPGTDTSDAPPDRWPSSPAHPARGPSAPATCSSTHA